MKTIQQAVILKVSPHEVYEALMDSRKHSKFTGEEASISREVGGKFSAYGDYITGVNLELVPDKKSSSHGVGKIGLRGIILKLLFIWKK